MRGLLLITNAFCRMPLGFEFESLRDDKFGCAHRRADFIFESGGCAATPDFSLRAQRKVSKRKGTLLTRPSAALRVLSLAGARQLAAAQTRLAFFLPGAAMLDVLERKQSRLVQTHLWEPSPLGEDFARSADSCEKTGKSANCDLRATEQHRANRKQETVCLSTASLRSRLFDRVREGTRRVVRRSEWFW